MNKTELIKKVETETSLVKFFKLKTEILKALKGEGKEVKNG